MATERIEQKFLELLEDRLSRDDRSQLSRALLEDKELRQEFDATSKLHQGLRQLHDLPLPVTPNFSANVMRQIRTNARGPRLSFLPIWAEDFLIKVAAPAFSLAIILLLFLGSGSFEIPKLGSPLSTISRSYAPEVAPVQFQVTYKNQRMLKVLELADTTNGSEPAVLFTLLTGLASVICLMKNRFRTALGFGFMGFLVFFFKFIIPAVAGLN